MLEHGRSTIANVSSLAAVGAREAYYKHIESHEHVRLELRWLYDVTSSE